MQVGLKQAEIGKIYNLSQAQISRILAKAIYKLKLRLRKGGDVYGDS